MVFKNVATSNGSSGLRIRWLQRLLADATKNFKAAISEMIPDHSGYEAIKGLVDFLESDDTQNMISREGLFSEAAKSKLHVYSNNIAALFVETGVLCQI